jgi:hypothetical protein
MALERKNNIIIISMLGKVRLITECYELPKSIQNILFDTSQRKDPISFKDLFSRGFVMILRSVSFRSSGMLQ